MAFAVGHRTQAGAVEYANALQRIVSNGGAIGEVPRGRRVVGGYSVGGSTVSNEYNGYFKIIDASERDEKGNVTAYKVKVVDGAAADNLESYMYCKVNNRSVDVPCTVSSALEISKSYFVAIKCTISGRFDIIGEIVFIDKHNRFPSDTFEILYYEIGSVDFIQSDSKFVLNINQRFPSDASLRSLSGVNGVPQLIWFAERCNNV